MATPVACNAVSTSETVADGFACFNTAQLPATWGAAIEVPAKLVNEPPGIEERIKRPGASNERNDALLEKGSETASAIVPFEPSSVEPTLIAVEMQAGKLRALMKPLFPDAMAVAIPTERRLSMATLSDWVSQFVGNPCPPPRLMLTEAKE